MINNSSYSLGRAALYGASMLAFGGTGYYLGNEWLNSSFSAPLTSLDSLILYYPKTVLLACTASGSAVGVINAFGLDMLGVEILAARVSRGLLRFLNAGAPPER